MRAGVRALAGVIAVGVCAGAGPAESATWEQRVAAARRYADVRAGSVSFALVDEHGRLRGHRANRITPSASVLKAMLLVAYVRQDSVRRRPLREAERRLLAPMIRWSDNAAATIVLNLLGTRRIELFARAVGMRHFRLRSPWGLSEINAAEQARFFNRIGRHLPRRHRVYALRLLAGIVPSQRWGIPPVRPRGWSLFFKGGWGSGTGWVTHQVALLRKGENRVSLAVLTQFNPSYDYGTRTIRGIAARLLRAPLPPAG